MPFCIKNRLANNQTQMLLKRDNGWVKWIFLMLALLFFLQPSLYFFRLKATLYMLCNRSFNSYRKNYETLLFFSITALLFAIYSCKGKFLFINKILNYEKMHVRYCGLIISE